MDRETLKAAHRKVSSLDKQITDLETAAQRAEETTAEAAAELAKHAGLDKIVSRWRVDQLKKNANAKVLPEKLKARVDAKRDAEETLTQTREAQQMIVEELEELRRKRDQAEQERMATAIGVLHGIADGLGNELMTLNRRRVELLQILRGLFLMKVPDAISRNVQASTAALVAMKTGDSFQFQPNTVPDPLEEMASRWNRRLLALCADPEAAILTPRHLEPSDYVPGQPGEGGGPGHRFPGVPVGAWKPEQV